MSTVIDISEKFDELIPTVLSESWDKDGLCLCADEKRVIKKAVIALDATKRIIEAAANCNADLIITHHPLIFHPMQTVLSYDSVGKRILAASKAGISILSYHTRLDKLQGGVNTCLAKNLNLIQTEPFRDNIGLSGYLKNKMTPEEFRDYVSLCLKTKYVRLAKSTDNCNKIAILGGSGKSFVSEVYQSGADTFVTGEVNYSTALDFMELGINLITATHYATEAVVLPKLQQILNKSFPDIDSIIVENEDIQK